MISEKFVCFHGILLFFSTVTNNLHNLGAMQPQQPPTSVAAAAVSTQDPTLTNVATTHHSYHGSQVSKIRIIS